MFHPLPDEGVWGVYLGDRQSAERVLCQLLEATGNVAVEMYHGTAWKVTVRTPHRVLDDELIRALISDDPEPAMDAYRYNPVALQMVWELVRPCGSLTTDGLHFNLTAFDFAWRMHLLANIYGALRSDESPLLYTRYGNPVEQQVELFVGYRTPDLKPEAMQETAHLLQQHLGPLGLVSHQWGPSTMGWGVKMNGDSALSCILGVGGAVERDQRGQPTRLRIPHRRRVLRYAYFRGVRHARRDTPVRRLSRAHGNTIVKKLPSYFGHFIHEEAEDMIVDLEGARAVAGMMTEGISGCDDAINLAMSLLVAKLGIVCARMSGLRVSSNERFVGVGAPRIESERMREAMARLTAALPGQSEFCPIRL